MAFLPLSQSQTLTRKATPNKFPVSRPGNGFLIRTSGQQFLFLQATRLKVAENLHFNRYFSEVYTHTTCNNEFTERHPVVAELKDGPRQQRFGVVECISSRSTTYLPFALKTWSNNGCKRDL